MTNNLKIPSNLLEPMILAYSILDPSFFMKTKSYLDTNRQKGKSYFSDEKNQKVYNLISLIFDKYEKIPKKNTVLTIIDRLKEDPEVKFLMTTIVEKMYSATMDQIDEKYIEDETINFIKENNAYEAIMLGQEDIQNGNFGSLLTRMEEAVRVNFDKDLGLSIKDLDEAIKRIDNLNNEATFSTGFLNLDSVLDGGMHPKELYVVSAIPAGGKTLFLGNLAINAFLEGKKVLVYTFETSTERLMMRYFSNIAQMGKKEIILDEEGMKDKVEQAVSISEGDLIVKEFNANSVSSNDLLAHINDLIRYKNWKPDLVVVDYILIMLTNDKKRSSGDSSHDYYKTITEELRNIGKSLYIPVWSAVQINREGMSDRGGSKTVVTAKDIAASRGIFDTTDFFSIIIQSAKDKEKNKMFLYIDKNRNDRSGMKIEFDINYEFMKLTEGAIIN